MSHAVKRCKPIVVLRDLSFVIPTDLPEYPDKGVNWKKLNSLINGSRTLIYSGCYLEECAKILKDIRTDPISNAFRFYTPDDYLPVKSVNFSKPGAIAVNSKGNIYVTSYDSMIGVFDSNGASVSSFGSKGDKDGQFDSPAGIAVNPHTNLVYVSDFNNHRIQILDENGNFKNKFGNQGNEDGQFNKPSGIAINSRNEVIVCDYNNDRIQIFDANGTFIRKFGSNGDLDGQFDGPTGVAVSSDDSIFLNSSQIS